MSQTTPVLLFLLLLVGLIAISMAGDRSFRSRRGPRRFRNRFIWFPVGPYSGGSSGGGFGGAAAPAEVGNRSREAVSFQQSASDTPFAMTELSGYAALTRPTVEC